jgi:hypothetical protein
MDGSSESVSPANPKAGATVDLDNRPQNVAATSANANSAGAPRLEFRKLDLSIRDNEYVAGQRNITAVVIRNTYPEPIKLIAVTARHSSLNSQEYDQIFRGSLNKKLRPSRTNIRFRIYEWNPLSWLRGSSRDRFQKPVFELNHSALNSIPTENLEPITINAQENSKISLDQFSAANREITINAKPGAIVSITEDTKATRRPKELIVSPSSEVVSEYAWKTSHAILFIPSRIGIDIEIRYSICDEERSQVVSSIFDIKPPMSAILLGGICGGVTGNLARSFMEIDVPALDSRFFVKLIGSCLLSVMAVISLSRKSGSQAFITVEDFFGAFVLGSLIGYQGTAFFEKTVTDARTASPPPTGR